MTHKISWDQPASRIFETGLDRGVLYPRGSKGVAWNGLISVDENGGESSVAHYIDGRPFLYLPKPKEFSATLKAYTYPDEFSALMGEVEAADGMYLDSQMGDAFDLCYRTIIGNNVEGTDFGYKLHLVYNASVAPVSRSYGAMADTINPVEFSWEINAVPVTVPGYRATAHITIDTRHVDPDKLVDLQAMLYGTANSDPYMPRPDKLIDMLTFGDEIEIIDNGDGTWTAKGSYRNIYKLNTKTFEIDNVNAIDNGDGTYAISSTP